MRRTGCVFVHEDKMKVLVGVNTNERYTMSVGKEDYKDKENLMITGFRELQTKTHTNLLPVKKPQTPLLVFIHFFFHPLFEEADVDAASTVT